MNQRKEKLEQFLEEFHELITFFVHLFSVVDKREKSKYKATISQCYTLRSLKGCKGMTMKQLSETMGIAKSTMTRNIDKMVKNGYLERVRGELDKREVLIRLAKKGRKLVKIMHESEKYFTLKVVKDIPEEVWDDVLISLRYLLKAFKKRKEENMSK
jgi:DNA-binding MarR family transcriptional regulator